MQITITIPKLTTIAARWRWGLLAAFVVAALILGLGSQSYQQAAANASTEVEFSIAAVGCSTANPAELDKCTFDAGSSFTLDMSWDGFTGLHAQGARDVQMVIHWTGAVSGPNNANGKSLTNSSPAGCDIPVTVLEPGGDPTRAIISCEISIASNIATGVMGSALFNCDSVGVGTITLEHSATPGGTFAVGPSFGLHWENNATDFLLVNCGGPEMSLSVKAGATSCDAPQKPTKCDVPIGASFTLSVSVNTLPAATAGAGYRGFQTQVVWSNSLAYKGKTTDGCVEVVWPDSGNSFCSSLKNVRQVPPHTIIGQADLTLGTVISTHIGNIYDIVINCTPSPSSGNKIVLTVGDPLFYPDGSGFIDADFNSIGAKATGTQSVDVDGDTIPEIVQIADTLLINCVPPPQEINITALSVQLLLPDACFQVSNAANTQVLFTVCDNDFQGPPPTSPICNEDGTPACEDTDPADGSIRVSVVPGNYSVQEVKPPPGHLLNTSKLACDAKTAKCDLVFKNASISNPWFPWDLNGDNAVAFADFLLVLQHFNTQKP